MSVVPEASLAERKRKLVHDELAEAALHLLAFQGFEETTIDQIVAAAGVSRRTFFRYFRSKEDVVVESVGDMGAQLCAELRARPAGETPAEALRHAVSVLIRHTVEHPAKALRLTRSILDTPALRARYLERQAQWRTDLTTELARRHGRDALADLRPALAAAVALAAFDTALNHWTASDGTEDLAGLTDQAFAIVAGALDAAG